MNIEKSLQIEEYFLKFPLKSLLSPHKNLVTTAFKDYFDSVGGFRKHSSYQVNSRITDFHELLLDSKYNIRESKAVIAIYNNIAEELSRKEDKTLLF